MSIAVVTGSGGLIGAETVRMLAARGLQVIGIDNDMRSYFFGTGASTRWQVENLTKNQPCYTHSDLDIRDVEGIGALFRKYGSDIKLVVHCAAQPSHDWAAREPVTDFTVNANGTMNLLEACRAFASEAVFIFVSTNKVYGDRPNALPLVELDTRFELSPEHPWATHGFPEEMSIDGCLHSLFGASKVAADILVQEYGRYFGMKTACFRGGCLTGPGHSGAQLHGFLAYLMQCALTGKPYTIFGYKGKQVRDNIHSRDLVDAFWCFFENPGSGEVFNIGGSRHSNCSMQEAVKIAQEIAGREMNLSYQEDNRIGDHIWWVSDIRRFQQRFPQWSFKYDIGSIMRDIRDGLTERLAPA